MKKDDWAPVEKPPELSMRVILLFVEFGFEGRHWCTGTYHHLQGVWEIDSKHHRGLTLSHWKDPKCLNLPPVVLL